MSNIKSITKKEELDTVLSEEKDKVVLLKFQATWCGPCRVYGENIKSLPDDVWDNLVVLEADVDEAEDLASEYGVRNIPQSFFFTNGKLVSKEVGLLTKNKLIEKVKETKE